jgi:hypothetical protein
MRKHKGAIHGVMPNPEAGVTRFAHLGLFSYTLNQGTA